MKGLTKSLSRLEHLPRWLITGLIFSLILGLGGDFIANERPLVVRFEGRIYFPVCRAYLQAWGWLEHHPVMEVRNEHHRQFWMLRPPIVYRYNTIDSRHANYVGPFDHQQLAWRERHWLGTDQLGRDTLAGLVAGLRVAWLVGLGAVWLAAVLGLGLGILAGYFGNRFWKVGLADLILLGLLLVGSIYFWVIFYPWYSFSLSRGGLSLKLSWCLVLGGGLILWIMRTKSLSRRWYVPADTFILKLIEWLKAVPGVFLVLTILGLVDQPTLGSLILIIGLTAWPTMAQYTRAELLKVKHQPFVESVYALGLSHFRILAVHILPVILGPLAITWAFAFSNAVLIESGLSFLGLGLAVDQVSWGSLLNEARQHLPAWWLALFPGLGIFSMVYAFNRLGDAILLAFQPEESRKPL